MEVPAVRHEEYYTCCEEPYPDIVFKIYLRRKTLFYTVNHLSPRGGRFSFLVSTKKIHFQKNYRIVPERWINIFCIRMSVFPLPSVWTSGAPLCCTRRRNVL